MPVNEQQFFQNKFNYKEFLKWADDIRESVQALNKFTPGHTMRKDPAILKDFLVRSGITTTYQLASTAKAQEQDAIISNEKLDVKRATEWVVKHNEESIAEDKKAQAAENLLADETYFDQIVAGEEQLRQEAADFNPAELDARNPIPEAERRDTNRNRVGEPIEQEYTAVEFPQHGREWENNSRRISEVLSSASAFEVMSGYKPIGDKTPNDREFKSWVIVKGSDKSQWESDMTKTFTPERPYSDYANEVLEKIEQAKYPGSYKFFIEKLHGRYSDGTSYKMNPVRSQRGITEVGGMNLSNRMVFSAYIENYNDGLSIDSGAYSFLGRAEPVPIYKSTTRNMTLEFTLLSDYSSELMIGMEKLNAQLGRQQNATTDEIVEKLVNGSGVDWGLGHFTYPKIVNGARVGGHIPGMYSDTPEGLWSKLTFLEQCFYPYYRDDGKMKEQPMIRMRIADFYDVIVSPKDLNLQMTALGDSPQVDMNPSSLGNMPLGMKVTIQGTIIHNYEPSSNFFGFFHRTEFDSKTLDPVTGTNINLQKDKIQDGMTKKSPATAKHGFNEKLLDGNILGNNDKVNKSLQDFKNIFAPLQTPGIKMEDAATKKQMLKAITAYKAVEDVVNHLRILEGLPPVSAEDAVAGEFKTTQNNGSGAIKGAEVSNNPVSILKKAAFDKVDVVKEGLKNATKAATPAPQPKTFQDMFKKK